MLIVQWQTTSIVHNSQKIHAEDLLNVVTKIVENQHYSIEFHRQETTTLRKNELKNVVDIAHELLADYHKKYLSGAYELNQAQRLAKQTLKNIRWADGVGYFWINDTTSPIPKMIMHPTLPELDGVVLDDPVFDCALGVNENLFVAANTVCKADGSGYVDYLWPKPTTDGDLTTKQPKISYVRLFTPWAWVIGSGVYIDDIEAQTNRRIDVVIEELRQTFKTTHIGENSYMFIFTSDKQMLIHPELQGQDVSELRNPDTGRFLFDEIILAEQSLNKTFDYIWRKPTEDASRQFNKKLHVSYFEPLKWYICVSYYQDEVNRPVRTLAWRMVALSLFILSIALLLSFILGKNLSAPLKKLSSAAITIDKEGVGAVEMPISGSKETRDLGQILSQTFTTIGEKELSLRENEKKLKRIEKNLRQQLGFTQSLLSAIPEPVFFKDTYGRYIGCNQAFSDLVGVPRDRIQGKTAFDLWPQALAEEYHNIDLGLIAKPQSIEFQVSDINGGERHVIYNNDLFRDDNGDVAGLVGLFFDISQRLQAEKAVRESELKYRQLVENASDAIFIAQDGTMTFANSKTSELSGYDADELKKIPFLNLVHPDDQAMVRDRYIRRIKGEKGLPETYTFRMVSKDNSEITVLLSSAVVQWNNNSAVLCFARDITERKKLETAFFQAQKMDAIGKLAGGVAHDFNNMLGGILGAAQLVKITTKNLGEKSTNNIDLIIKSVTRAADLTAKLLAFGGKGKIMSTAIDIHNIIDDAFAIFHRTFDKRIKFSIKQAADKHIFTGDDSAMQNVFINLGINASHAIVSGGELIIETRNIYLDENFCESSAFAVEPGEYIDVEVRDTGVGIPRDDLQKIFEPFYTTKQKDKGTGLGLAAVYGTIQDHRGAISVESDVGVGTTFHLYLPCSEDVVTVTPTELQSPDAKGEGTILLVDDEEVIRCTGKEMLEDMGYDVLVAENGKEGLELFRNRYDEIDLSIVDMIMPELSGREAFIQMKDIDIDCKIIISSGFTKNESLSDIRELGLAGFIRKPFSYNDLNRLLFSVLSR